MANAILRAVKEPGPIPNAIYDILSQPFQYKIGIVIAFGGLDKLNELIS